MSSHQRMGSNSSDPQYSSSNSFGNIYASEASGYSSNSTENLQKQMQVKDKAIAELVRIVESLEANYELSIETQIYNSKNMLLIARCMEEEARAAILTEGPYPRACASL